MKSTRFDAALDFPWGNLPSEVRVRLALGAERIPAVLSDYQIPGRKAAPFGRVALGRALEVRWRDRFGIQGWDGRDLGHGVCVHPFSTDGLKPGQRKALLGRLSLGEKEMIQALADRAGVQGLRGRDVSDFCRLSRFRVESLAGKLEEEGAVRILSFSPLFLVSQGSLDFVRGKIASYLARFHKTHAGQRGAPLEKIENRFGLPHPVLVLAVRLLAKEGRVVEADGVLRLPDFRIPLGPEDEEALSALERMLLDSEAGAVDLEDVRRRLHWRPGKLQTILAVLAERKKIVEAPDGFILHSEWLDGLVRKIRESGKRELTVADFKEMTGLSRKYAIPLLELLDRMGVTRRKGGVRDIL